VSTILDALKKVERDREAPQEEVLAEIGLPTEAPRRGIPTRVIVACASIGFAAGIGLALWRDTAPLQQGPPPEPVTAPIIDVPPPPQPAKPAGPAVNPPAAVPGAPAVDAAGPASAPPAAVNPPVANPPPPAAGNQIVAGSDAPAGAVVEPSPFAPGTEPGAAAAAKPGARGTRKPRAAMPPGAVAPPPQVALAPPPPVVAPLPPAVAPPAPAPEPLPPPVQAEPAQPPAVVIDTGRSPPGTPRVALTFLQWSADPNRRFAFVSIDGAPAMRVREGDTASGMTVAEITPTGVEFKREGQLFMIRPRH
jgi:hypothetical protein